MTYKRIPRGYVSEEAARRVRGEVVDNSTIKPPNNNSHSASTSDIIAKFEKNYTYPAQCKVCAIEPEVLDVIDTLLERGAGADSVSMFLMDTFCISIARTTLLRHKKLHLDA